MNKGKKSLLALGAVAAFGVSAWGVQTTFAASPAAGKNGHMAGLVEAIATKFHLNPEEVQSVIDAERQKAEAAHQADFKSRLADAVTAGKLTQAQADAIIAKQAEEKVFFESLKDKTEAERQAALKEHMTALKAWVDNNKIPRDFAFFGFGPGRPGNRGHMNGKDFEGDKSGRDHRGMMGGFMRNGGEQKTKN